MHANDLAKTQQLQIRVSPSEKQLIRDRAKRAGMTVSAFVLDQLLNRRRSEWESLVAQLASTNSLRYVLADVNDFLANLSLEEFDRIVAEPSVTHEHYLANYLAAMVECAAVRLGGVPPPWTRHIQPLDKPVFGTQLKSLRLHLLTQTPLPFRRRNIFVDSSIGDRV